MAGVGASGSARAMETWLLPFAAMFTQPSWLECGGAGERGVAVPAPADGVRGAAGSRRQLGQGVRRFPPVPLARGLVGPAGHADPAWPVPAIFVPEGAPLVIAVDNSVERRRGAKIRDKGIYRDAVRSSRGCFVEVRRSVAVVAGGGPALRRRTLGVPCADS